MKVLKNAFWLATGRIAADLASFGLFTVVSRVFGPSGTGEWAYAFAIGNLVGIIGASGFDEYGVREYACSADAERAALWRNLTSGPLVRIAAAAALFAAFLLSGFVDVQRPMLLVEFAVYFVGWYLSRMLFVPALALQSMSAPALIDLACRGFAILLAIALALAGQPLYVVVMGFPLAGAALACLALRNARGHLPPRRTAPPHISWRGMRSALHGAAPFAAAELLNQFYARADVLLIAYWLGTGQTGLYAMPLKFVEVGLIPLMLFGTAVYPVIGRLSFSRSPLLEPAARDYTHAVFALTGWLGIGVALVVPLIIVPLFGAAFEPAASLLVWFGILAVCKGMETALSRLLFSVRRQGLYLRALALGTVLIVALNCLLIPYFGLRGAIAAAIVSTIAGDVLCVEGLRGHVRPRVFIGAAVRLAASIAIAIAAAAALRSVGGEPWMQALAAVLLFPPAAYALGLIPSRHGSLLAGHHADPPRQQPAPRRILWLTEEFYPPQIGGVELMVSRLSQTLADQGFDVQVITRQTDPPCAPSERIDGVKVRRIRPGGQHKGKGWRALPRIAGYLPNLALQLLCAARRCDVIIVSGAKVIPLVAVPLSRALGKRCIVRLESTCELTEPISRESAASMRGIGAALGSLAARAQRAALEGADDVIATSSALAAVLTQYGVSGARIREIPNGIDLRRFRPASAAERERLRAELAWPADGTILLFVARLSRAKGIDLLADAWPEIASRHPGLHLVIAGTGAGSYDDCEREVAESILRSGLGPERVRMTGVTDRVPDYLRAADLFILPSDYEGFSVGTVEALATGLPSILTPVGVVPQLVRDGENGFLFLPRDRRGMIAAIDAAMSARSRWTEIGCRARHAVLSMDLQAVAREYALLCATPPTRGRSRRNDRGAARDEQPPDQQQNTASHEHEALPH